MSDSEETSVAGDPEIDFDHADLNQTSKAVCSSCEVPITDAYFTLGEQAVCPGCKESISKAEPKGWGIARFMYAGMFGTFAGALGLSLMLAVAGSQLGCKESNDTFDKSFRESWRSSFIESCVDKAGETNREICVCTGTLAAERLTKTQLADAELIGEQILPECI